MSTTPTASAHVCTTTAPPTNWVGNIAQGPRCSDDYAERWNDPIYADWLSYFDAAGQPLHYAQRHADSLLLGESRWHVTIRQEMNGRLWDLRIKAVTDDFGWLVEVPA